MRALLLAAAVLAVALAGCSSPAQPPPVSSSVPLVLAFENRVGDGWGINVGVWGYRVYGEEARETWSTPGNGSTTISIPDGKADLRATLVRGTERGAQLFIHLTTLDANPRATFAWTPNAASSTGKTLVVDTVNASWTED